MVLPELFSLGVLPAALASLPAVLASEGTPPAAFDVSTVMESAVSTTQSQLFSVLAIVVPAIVAIVAAVVGVKFGIKWLRNLKE